MSTKRHHWLKLDENFFEDDTIKFIEEQEEGERYIIFYLKLCLKAVNKHGKLIAPNRGDLDFYDIKKLSDLTNMPMDTVAQAMKLFSRIGLIELTDNGDYKLNLKGGSLWQITENIITLN